MGDSQFNLSNVRAVAISKVSSISSTYNILPCWFLEQYFHFLVGACRNIFIPVADRELLQNHERRRPDV